MSAAIINSSHKFIKYFIRYNCLFCLLANYRFSDGTRVNQINLGQGRSYWASTAQSV